MLSGMSTDEQFADNIQTMTDFQPLSADEREALENALEIYRRKDVYKRQGLYRQPFEKERISEGDRRLV